MINFLFILFVCLLSEDEVDYVEYDYGIYCCQNNKVFGFFEVIKFIKDFFEFDFVWFYKKIFIKSGQMIVQVLNVVRNYFRYNLGRRQLLLVFFNKLIIIIIFFGKKKLKLYVC